MARLKGCILFTVVAISVVCFLVGLFLRDPKDLRKTLAESYFKSTQNLLSFKIDTGHKYQRK